jgi:ADP-heptose:LPS heptosyltransferase
MQKLILDNFQSPGDIVMLTAAVRDLHKCYPGRFLTDVRTGSAELWDNNPYLTPLREDDPEVKRLRCGYPLIHSSNQRPLHFLHGFINDLNDQLDLAIQLSRCAGDIHLSDAERTAPPMVERVISRAVPYWVVVAGGKFDYTIKWWHFRRWQAVVDHFRSRVLFVQVGENHHYHPALNGVLDLRNKTTLRDLIRLVYHAQGVICPVTLHMHLAAAIETKPGGPPSRPCVVVAGGREPPHWEAYPTHQFIHTVGLLHCCATGGCWRSRSVPLGDGNEKDKPEHLCVDVVNNLPRCMDLIQPAAVIEKIELYIQGALLKTLTAEEAELVNPFLFKRSDPAWRRPGPRMVSQEEIIGRTRTRQTKQTRGERYG